MPLASFSEGLRNVIMFLPGTYGTSLVRNHSLTSVLSKLEGEGIPAQAIEGLKDSIDCNLYFFGDKVETWVAYAVIIGTIVLLLTGYVLINLLNKKKNK
jgi:multidrug/hemolysin transport system permease protein